MYKKYRICFVSDTRPSLVPFLSMSFNQKLLTSPNTLVVYQLCLIFRKLLNLSKIYKTKGKLCESFIRIFFVIVFSIPMRQTPANIQLR